jgi:nucleolar protein 58
MSLGLSHSLSRYKLRFSPDKVDTMVVQAIALLDDLDKELNTYAMRVREWYGWHFPEMTKVVSDNIAYARAIKAMGTRDRAGETDFSAAGLDDEAEAALKAAALVSMGTEVSGDDLANITALCDQVVDLAEYRAQLADYLRARMAAIAPNLTVLVGELVGARLIAHAGSLISLAKVPASTVQILGAEKALFRALKTKHETPKYGLIYHASLVGQAAPRNKGKVSRVLAAKCALAVRVDALGEGTDAALGVESRAKVEARLRQLEGRALASDAGAARVAGGGAGKYSGGAGNGGAGGGLAAPARAYNADADAVAVPAAKEGKKEEKKEKEKKKDKKKDKEEGGKKDKKKRKADDEAAAKNGGGDDEAERKRKKKEEKKAKKKAGSDSD